MRRNKIIELPFLRNSISENAVSTMNVAYKNVVEENNTDNDYDVYVNIYTDLNDIISNIHGESQLIELYAREKVPDNKYLTKEADSIKQNCMRLTKIVNNLVELRKFEKKQACLFVNNVNIVEILDNIVINTSKYINYKIIFDTNIEEKYISCDINKIQKAILIILSAALKYSDEKDIFVNLNVSEDNIVIAVSFKDKNGELLKFFTNKMDNLNIDNLDELSLDLYLCKSLIALHEGSISVGGIAGKTILTIELPCDNSNQVYRLFTDDIKNEYLSEQIEIEFSDFTKYNGND